MLKSIFRLLLFCFFWGCVASNQPIGIRQQTDPNAFETDGSKTVVKEASLIEMISGVSKTAGELLEKCAIPASIYDSKDAGFPKSVINTSPFACGLGNGAVDELKSIPQLVILATDIAFKEEVRDALVQQFKALTPSKVGSALVGFGKQTLGTIAGSTDKDFHAKGKMTFEVATLIFGGGATKAGDALKAGDDMVTSLGKVTSKIDDMAGSPYKIFLAQTKNLRKLFEQLNPSQIKADDLNKFVDKLNALPQGQARKDLFEALDGTDVKLDELDGYIKAVEADPSKLTKEKWEELRKEKILPSLGQRLTKAEFKGLKDAVEKLSGDLKSKFFDDFANASDDVLKKLQDDNLLDNWKVVRLCDDQELSKLATNIDELELIAKNSKEIEAVGGYKSWRTTKVLSYEVLMGYKFYGIKALRIKEGVNGKIAIVGQSMGDYAKRAEYGVVDYARKLREKGYQTELFAGPRITDAARLQLEEKKLKLGRQLTPDELETTIAYKENMAWAKWVKDEGFTVIDIGNPNSKGYSHFYNGECENIFGK